MWSLLVNRRKRKPTIEFVTHVTEIAEYYPPVAGHVLPDWYRKARAFRKERRFPKLRLREDALMKACPGIQDYMGLGYTLSMWTDLLITATEEGFGFDSDMPKGLVTTFKPDQWEGCPRGSDHAHVLKINMPWKIRTPRGWSVLLLEPWYHKEARWSVFPGLVDSDILGTVTFVAAWHLPVGETTLIRAGTPMLHIVPVRRESLALSVAVDDEAMMGLHTSSLKTTTPGGSRIAAGAYREQQRLRESVGP